MNQEVLKPIAKPPNKSVENLSSLPVLSPIEFAPNSPFVPLKPSVNNNGSSLASPSPSIPPGSTLVKFTPSPRPSPYFSLSPTSLLAILAKKSKPPPVPKSNQYKSVKNYANNVHSTDEGYIRHLQSIAVPLFIEKGPLCDSEGFYQHNGECWNDSLQQILFNTDGMKEILQNLILTLDFSQYSIALSDHLFVPLDKLQTKDEYIAKYDEEIQVQKEWANLYLAETQKRFLRHYIAEALRRKQAIESCSLAEPDDVARAKLKEIGKRIEQRKGGLEAKRAAIFGKLLPIEEYAFRPTIEEYTKQVALTGGTDFDIFILFNILNEVFFPRNPFKINSQIPSTLKEAFGTTERFSKFLTFVNCCLVAASNRSKSEVDSHELAFYQCGMNQYLYDNNSGAVQFDWRLFLVVYFDLLVQEVYPMFFFLRVNFYDEDSDFLGYDFYPILQYKENEKYVTRILIEDEFLDISSQATDPKNPNFKFQVKTDTVQAYGEINRKTAYYIEKISFIYNDKTELPAANTTYGQNFSARLRRSPLEIFIFNRDTPNALKYIEENPVVPNLKATTASGDIPIVFLAVEYDLPEVAKKLLENGYAYTYVVSDTTPILHTLFKKQYDVFQTLLRLGADIQYMDSKGLQAIHYASTKDFPIEYLEALLEAGADVNTRSKNLTTPLMIATEDNETSKMKYLCLKGADVTARSANDKSVYSNSITAEQKDILDSCSRKGGMRKRRYTSKQRISKRKTAKNSKK